MKRLLLALALLALPVMAQDAPKPAPRPIEKLVRLKYADPQKISRLLNYFGVLMTWDSEMKVLAVHGTPEQIAAVEEAIKQLDVAGAAPKNIELTVYFVVGSDRENLEGNPVPQDLQNVITQLKNAFTFKNYRMLDMLTLRTRSGVGAETTGQLSASQLPSLTTFKVRSASVGEDGAIRIDGLHAGLRIIIASSQQKYDYADTGLSADVDVKEGQKVVVGRTSMAGPDKALFLILMAQVIN